MKPKTKLILEDSKELLKTVGRGAVKTVDFVISYEIFCMVVSGIKTILDEIFNWK